MKTTPLGQIAEKIKTLMYNARTVAAAELNNRLLKTYWEIGHIIVEHEQKGKAKAEYGTSLLTDLSKLLVSELGRGFSRSNLQNMRNFYLVYLNLPDASGKLTWSHYCEFINISDTKARGEYPLLR